MSLPESIEINSKQRKRILMTVNEIPKDVKTGLEIGFSDGQMTWALIKKIPCLYGIDLPRPIKDNIKKRRIFGNINNLPFSDRIFDIVICCEVLEHLDNKTYENGLKEINRICKKYILITVPNREKVWNNLTRCSWCGHVDHYSSHKRYLDESSFDRMVPDFSLLKTFQFGPIRHGYAPDWMYRLKHNFGVFSSRPWECENCGKMYELNKPKLIGKFIQSIIWRIERLTPGSPYWLLLLWKREK